MYGKKGKLRDRNSGRTIQLPNQSTENAILCARNSPSIVCARDVTTNVAGDDVGEKRGMDFLSAANSFFYTQLNEISAESILPHGDNRRNLVARTRRTIG